MHKDVNLATVSVMPDNRRHAKATQTARTCSIITSAVLLMLSITAAQAQQPRIMLEVPGTSPGMIEVCLQQDSLVDIFDLGGDVILSAVAAREDLGCPAEPGPDPVINNFVVSSVPVDPLDIDNTVNTFLDTSSSNCDPDQDPLTEDICLFVTWDVTRSVSPDVICQISQVEGASSTMTPTTFFNPGAFISSPTSFVEFRVNQTWPATDLANGDRAYRMTCGNNLKNVANVVSPTRTVTFGDGVSGVEITSFSITQTTAAQGSNINFNWQINSVGGAAINCTMSSVTAGVINDVPISTASGNSFVQILPDANLGDQDFTLDCQNLIGPMGTDTVLITESAGDQCPAEPPGRDDSQTFFNEVFGSTWPGNNGNVEDINVRNNEYKALRFTANTDGVRQSDTLRWFKPTSGGSNQSPAQVSITPCPGDFAPEDANCEVTSLFITGDLSWVIDTGTTTGACALTPSATYYLNVQYPDCTTTTCADAFEL